MIAAAAGVAKRGSYYRARASTVDFSVVGAAVRQRPPFRRDPARLQDPVHKARALANFRQARLLLFIIIITIIIICCCFCCCFCCFCCCCFCCCCCRCRCRCRCRCYFYRFAHRRRRRRSHRGL